MVDKININEKSFNIEVISGIALEAKRERIVNKKTEVSGGGGMIVNGTGIIEPIEISEKVTVDNLQDFVLCALDGSRHSFSFKNEEVSVDVHPGDIVSVVQGQRKKNGKFEPFIIYNHKSRLICTVGPFVDAAALSNIRMVVVAIVFAVIPLLFSAPWYISIVSAVAALTAQYVYYFKIKGYLTAGQYIDTPECKAWMTELGQNDADYDAMVTRVA